MLYSSQAHPIRPQHLAQEQSVRLKCSGPFPGPINAPRDPGISGSLLHALLLMYTLSDVRVGEREKQKSARRPSHSQAILPTMPVVLPSPQPLTDFPFLLPL